MFQLTDKQKEDVQRWIRTHKCSRKHDDAGAIGGKHTYCFTPTGVGVIEVVKCWCGKEIDLTDFSNW